MVCTFYFISLAYVYSVRRVKMKNPNEYDVVSRVIDNRIVFCTRMFSAI